MKGILKLVSFFWLISVTVLFSQTDSLNVYWNANSESDMFQYKLYRAVGNSGNYQLIKSIPHPQTHAVDRDNIHPGELYSYKLAAMDSAGNISPFTDPVSVGIPQVILTLNSISSGQPVTVPLTDAVFDPDDNISDLQISVSNASHLQVAVNGNNLEISSSPNNYTGPAEFTLRVEDPDGFWDKKTISLTVTGNTQFVFTVTIPPITFPEDGQFELWMDSCVTVSPYAPSDLSWEFLGLDHLQADYQASTRKVTFTPTVTNWFGKDTVIFQATDPDQNTRMEEVVVTVFPVNDPPEITIQNIFTSAISSNTFDLKLYATDPDNQPVELNWQFVGYTHFQFQWEDETQKIVKIISLDNTTSEDGKFIVTDPDGASDTSVVTIHYNPSQNNTPPVLSLPATLKLAEDSLIAVVLGNYVVDSTNTLSELVWDIQPGEHLQTQFEAQQTVLYIRPEADWWGESQVHIQVQDPGGLSAQASIQVRVAARVDLSSIKFNPLPGGRINVQIQTDIPSKVELTYWNNPTMLFTYRSPNFTKKHDFYLEQLAPDTTYSYTLTLTDTSGYQVTASDSVFQYQNRGEDSKSEKEIVVFPNPFRLKQGHEYVYFSNLPPGTQKITIYSLVGEKVNEILLDNIQVRRWQWKPVNQQNQQLASGLYIYLIKDEKGKKLKTGKLAIIR